MCHFHEGHVPRGLPFLGAGGRSLLAEDIRATVVIMAAPEKGFSMSLGGKKKAPAPVARPSTFSEKRGDEGDEDDKAKQPEMISEMVGGQVDGKKEAVKIIPAMQNTFSLGGAQHLRGALLAGGESEAAAAAAAPAAVEPTEDAAGALAVAAEPADSSEPALSEDAAAAQAMLSELRSGGSSIFKDAAAAAAAQDDTERYRLDVATRADAAELEAYESMPIEDFGKAYLRGLGWEEGKAVGNNPKAAIVEAIEYVPRPDRLGLGAAPKPKEPKEEGSKKRFIKPGESREPKKDMVYVDEKGRQRHVKKVGDKLVEREKSGFTKGALLAVTHGVHKGLYGRVVSTGGMDSDLRIVLKLTVNDETVTLPSTHCAPVVDANLERAQPGFTHKQTAAAAGGSAGESGGGGGGGEGSAGEGGNGGNGRGGGAESGDDEGDERKRGRHKEHKERKRDRSDRDRSDRDRSDRDRDRDRRDRDREPKRPKEGSSSQRERSAPSVLSGSGGGGGGGGGASASGFWVRESIRVRVVDKHFERGQLYNKKGVVVDVSGADSFSIRLDENGKLYENLCHAAVETALPKRGGTVMLLAGPHKLRRGTLLERHSEEARAVVQFGGDLQIAQCSFDECAEWVGVLGNQLDEADL